MNEPNGTVQCSLLAMLQDLRENKKATAETSQRNFNNRFHHHLRSRLKLYVIIYSESRSRIAQTKKKERLEGSEEKKQKIIPPCVWWIYMIL